MGDSMFWRIVEYADALSEGDLYDKCRAIEGLVSALDREDALLFSRCFDEKMHDAYQWSLWAAAYLLGQGCTETQFYHFRANLISEGRHRYKQVLSQPQCLTEEDMEAELCFFDGYAQAIQQGIKTAMGCLPPQQPAEPPLIGHRWHSSQIYEQFPEAR